jgi:hypothetical protein
MLLAFFEFLDYIVPNFMTEWWFLILMGLGLAALIGVFIFLRMRQSDDDTD